MEWTFVRETEDGIVYPFDLADLRAEGVSASQRTDPRSLAKHGVYHVHTRGRADAPVGYRAVLPDQPEKQGQFWVREYVHTPLPPSEMNTVLAKAVTAKANELITAGTSFPVTGITNPIPLTGRLKDQTVYLGLLARAQGYKAAGVTTPVMTIRDGANINHALTPDQMLELISQAMSWFEAVVKVSWAMKDGQAPFEAGIPGDFEAEGYWV